MISLRQTILSCLGKFPNKTDVDLKIISEKNFNDYKRLLIEYSVEENERVQSYLLLPKKLQEKNPAVVAIHPRSSNWDLGKSEVVGILGDGTCSYGVDLVKLGYVVIAPDLLCFESRQNEKFKSKKEYQQAYEKFQFCKYVQYGSCLQTKYIHDLSVAIDVLESLEYVDKNRISAIGHSL